MGKYSKRKKNFYLACNKKFKTEEFQNAVGFLATCNAHVNVCIKEGFSLLNYYGDILYGPETDKDETAESKAETSTENKEVCEQSNEKSCEDSSDDDLEASLKKEVNTLQVENKTPFKKTRRFRALKCPAPSHIFFKANLEDPLPLLTKAMDDIISSKEQKSKHIIRLLPVHMTCKAFLEKIEKQLDLFCSQRFKDQERNFYVVVNVKSNSSVKKEEVLSIVLKVMNDVAPKCKAVLTEADVAIIVTVLATHCFIGEAPNYLTHYKKYNLLELVNPSDKTPKKSDLDQLILENDKIVPNASVLEQIESIK